MTSRPPSKRGGRRPGAGAPKGNLNALSSGRYTADPELRLILAQLPAPLRDALLPYLRANAETIKRRLASAARHQIQPTNVIPIRRSQPTSTTTTHAERSNAALIGSLALRAAAWGFIGARPFLMAHSPAAPIFAALLDDLDAQADAGATPPRNPGGLLRQTFHLELANHDGAVSRCPYCRWTFESPKEATQ